MRQSMNQKTRVGIIMGGFSAERHISVESGRNVYEKLASSGIYTPIPIFLAGAPNAHALFILPINILLKDSADDIHDKLLQPAQICEADATIAALQLHFKKYVGNTTFSPIPIDYHELPKIVDMVFLALHGRPGEDGTLQQILEDLKLPYNGSGVATTQRAIDKFATNRFLHQHGIHVADQYIVSKELWQTNKSQVIKQISTQFKYPFIAKPVDDGCSVAVLKIKDEAMLSAYANELFKDDTSSTRQPTSCDSNFQTNTSLPIYERFLVETLITQEMASYFLEITGGLLTLFDKHGQRQYEIFPPSETVAKSDILSLEEKFLAGEGQNITPARFNADAEKNKMILEQVQADLKKVAVLLDIEGYARIDAMVKIFPQHIETWVIEVNTLPALTPATCIFHQAALQGYKPFDFIHKIIQYAFERRKIMAV